VAAEARGTFHACGRGEASRLEMAQAILDAAGVAAKVEPALASEMLRQAARPRRAVLSTEKLRGATGFRFPPWRESLRAFVKSLKSGG
jgi:dTDP-4-dehydrorhamnose reductase